MIMTMFTFKDKPAFYTSQKATIKREELLWDTIKILMTHRQFFKLWISFGAFYSNLIVLPQILDEIVSVFNYNPDSAALFGMLNVIGGIAGSFLFGYYLK